MGRIEMDPIPTVQMRGILLQEAHRHPYIEALGSMYLLKLRYGPRFCTSAGSCWRLVFVHALMPWLKKHRLIEMFDQDYMCVDAEEADSGDLRRSKSLRIDPNLLGARRRNNFVAANSKLKEENEQLKVSMMALQRQLSMMSMNLPRVVRHDISESTENTALTQESGLSRTSSKSRKSTKESRDGKHVKAKKPKQSRTKSADDAYAVSDSDRAQIQEFLSESGNPLPRAEPTQVKKTKRGTKVPKAKKTKKPIRDYPSKDGGAS